MFCHGCATGVGLLTVPKGLPGDALGTCVNCHALACGWHGHRDPNVPEYMCVECDPALLVASSSQIARTTGTDHDPPPPDALLASFSYHRFDGTDGSWELWIVRSLDHFQDRRPGYGPQFFERVRNSRLNGPRVFMLPLVETAAELIIAAHILVREFEIQRSPLTDFLQNFEVSSRG